MSETVLLRAKFPMKLAACLAQCEPILLQASKVCVFCFIWKGRVKIEANHPIWVLCMLIQQRGNLAALISFVLCLQIPSDSFVDRVPYFYKLIRFVCYNALGYYDLPAGRDSNLLLSLLLAASVILPAIGCPSAVGVADLFAFAVRRDRLI